VSRRETIGLVARRELTEGLRSRPWRAALLIQMLVVAGIAIVSIVTSGGSGLHTRHLAIAGPRATAIAAKARTEANGYGIRLEVEDVTSAAVAREKVKDKDADAALGPAGLTVAQVRAALEPPPLPTVEITAGEGEGGTGLAYIGALLLYVALVSFGYAIASSVVAEKSSRVVEVILSAIRPVQLLAGKLIGVGILGLIQIAAVAAVGLAIAVPGGAVSLPSSTFETVVLVLVFFVLGYVFYGGLFAAAASLVSRQEDTQSTTAPILIVLIGSYLATNAALGNPSGGLATVGTFLPPMAPMVVPGRAAQGALPAGELVVSLLLMLAAIAVVVVVAARIYDRSVLRFGTPMRLRDAVRLAVRRD
jgi:ABC-2 type transport system permease protein